MSNFEQKINIDQNIHLQKMSDYEEAFRKLYVLIFMKGSHWCYWCKWNNPKIYHIRGDRKILIGSKTWIYIKNWNIE